MGVAIDEVVAETVEETRSAPAASGGGGGGAGGGEPDMDRLDYQMRRRRHRAERLWAD